MIDRTKLTREENGWTLQEFQSGTIIVRPNNPYSPHYYVTGSRWDDQNARREVAKDLRDYLGLKIDRPVWLDNAFRDSPTTLVHEDGFCIAATGPMILRPGSDPSALDWIEDPSDEARDRRVLLIDIIELGAV